MNRNRRRLEMSARECLNFFKRNAQTSVQPVTSFQIFNPNRTHFEQFP